MPPRLEPPLPPEGPATEGTITAARAAGGTLASLRVVVAWLVLPNAAMFLVARVFGVQRGVVNGDYVLVPLVLALAGPRAARLAVALLLGLDALAALAPVYHFQPADAFLALAQVPELSWRFAVPIAVLATVLGWALSRGLVRASGVRVTPRGVAVLLVGLTLVVAADALNGTNLLSRGRPVRSSLNLATSAVVEIGGRVATRRRAAPVTDPAPAPRAAAGIAAAESGATGNALLVVVESWGAFASGQAGDERLLAPLLSDSVRARYEVEIGSVPFAGGTTRAELRELCGVRAGPDDLPRVRVEGCLPAALRRAGYATLAVHGHSAATFGRADWYPRLGFDSALFAPELTARGFAQRCGFSFRGVCDTEALASIRERLRAATRPTFVYWLTLSSHLPLDARAAAATPAPCGSVPEAAHDTSACLLLRLHTAVFRGVASLLLDPALPPTRVVLVGDHPPPFLQPDRRALYRSDRVPYVTLTPRRASAAPAAAPAAARAVAPAAPRLGS